MMTLSLTLGLICPFSSTYTLDLIPQISTFQLSILSYSCCNLAKVSSRYLSPGNFDFYSHFNMLINICNLLCFVITYHDVVLVDFSTTRIVARMPILFIIRFIFTKEEKVTFNTLTVYAYSCS